LDEVTHDLDGVEIPDLLPRAGAVDRRLGALREVDVPSLSEQVHPELKRNTLLIPGPDQDERASIVVVVADQELRDRGTFLLGERLGDLCRVSCLSRPSWSESGARPQARKLTLIRSELPRSLGGSFRVERDGGRQG
jgi:hypothetical protein